MRLRAFALVSIARRLGRYRACVDFPISGRRSGRWRSTALGLEFARGGQPACRTLWPELRGRRGLSRAFPLSPSGTDRRAPAAAPGWLVQPRDVFVRSAPCQIHRARGPVRSPGISDPSRSRAARAAAGPAEMSGGPGLAPSWARGRRENRIPALRGPAPVPWPFVDR